MVDLDLASGCSPARYPVIRAVSWGSASSPTMMVDELGVVVDEHVDQRHRGVGEPISRSQDAVPPMAIQSPVAIGPHSATLSRTAG